MGKLKEGESLKVGDVGKVSRSRGSEAKWGDGSVGKWAEKKEG